MRGPRHITIEAWVLGVFISGLVVMLILLTLSWYNSVIYERAEDQAVRFNENLIVMGDLVLSLEQAESCQQEYLLLADEATRQDCGKILSDVQEKYLHLERLMGSDQENMDLSHRIRDLKDRKVLALTVMIELTKAGNRQASLTLLQARAGEMEMEQLRSALHNMRVTRRQELTELLSDSQKRASGSIALAIVLTLSAIAGLLTAYVVINRSLSARRRLTQVLAQDKSRDALTGLPNRSMFMDWGEQALTEARRIGASMAVLYLDLDLLSEVNKQLGTKGGDAALIEAGHRFRDAIRQTDMIARLCEDEFAILLSGTSSVSNVATLARRLIDVMSRPLLPELHELHIGVSIGIAVFPEDGHEIKDLLENAHKAMLAAKSQGKNRYRFYYDDANQLVSRQETLSQDLFNAVANKELYLLYQPKVDLDTGFMVGAEALLRWKHPFFGEVGPQEFIPIAEANGAILTIGAWVLRTICLQMVKWKRDQGFVRRISVNVSSRQLLESRLSSALEEFLAESQVPADMIEVELVERMLVEPAAAAEIDRLKSLGIRISIDDFGTGYSSLSYFRRFSIDMIKIDKSFVDGLPGDSSNATLTQTIIGMAQGMGIEVIAEGVETVEQADFLRLHGCRLVQGYLFARAMPPDDLVEWDASRQALGGDGEGI